MATLVNLKRNTRRQFLRDYARWKAVHWLYKSPPLDLEFVSILRISLEAIFWDIGMFIAPFIGGEIP